MYKKRNESISRFVFRKLVSISQEINWKVIKTSKKLTVKDCYAFNR